MFVALLGRLHRRCRAAARGLVKAARASGTLSAIYADAVAMLAHVLGDRMPGAERRRQHQADVALLQQVRSGVAIAGLEAAIGRSA